MQAESFDPILTTAPLKPSETPEGIEDSAALLQSFASVPSLAKAWAFPSTDGVRIALQHSQRNLPANAQRKFLTNFSLNEAVLEHGEADTSLPLDLRDALVVSPSPSGKRMLIVRPAGNGNKETSGILEIWDRSRVLQEIYIPASLHGSIYNDGWFGSSACWSPDESRLAYVAEMPVLSKTPEFGGAQKGPDGKKVEGAGPKGWRGIGEFQEDWGELNTGKRAPTLFVLELSSGQVAEVQGLPENSSVGQPQWSPDGNALVFVAWEHTASNFPEFPQRLGIVFCFNRPCALHAVAWPQPAERGAAPPAVRLVPASLQSSFSPRFSPDGKNLVILSQAAAVESGAHAATPALLSLPWQDVAPAIAASNTTSTAPLPQPRRVVDVVWNPSDIDAFPGLYCNVLPEQPFVGTSKTLVTTVQWRSNFAVVAIDIESGQVTRISPNNGSSWSLLAVQQGKFQ
jgi:acylaminoacyl-peptidase